MAGNIEKGEASTPLGERLKIRLDENLDVLFAGMDLDTDSLVAKVQETQSRTSLLGGYFHEYF